METDTFTIPNPKRDRSSAAGRAGWYPYYAGFSSDFASTMIDRYCLKNNDRVLDPWNGSGTTTASAAGRGIQSFGFDLNPVMTVVARARLLNKRERSSLLPIANAAIENHSDIGLSNSDPLLSWFKPSAAKQFRQIEFGLQKLLIGNDSLKLMFIQLQEDFSDLLAFFYVALFRTARELLSSRQSSNPTWMKLPDTANSRLNPSKSTILATFLSNVRRMEGALDADNFDKDGRVRIALASSKKIPIESGSINFILTSPPYCTRIDYAAATRIELAVLGIGENSQYETLRRELLGTPTVTKHPPSWKSDWGKESKTFLDQVHSHWSRSSVSYYHKGYCQYFDGLQSSIAEISRCLSKNGNACVVLQDSYYKEIRIDLSTVFIQMANSSGLYLDVRSDFSSRNSLAQLNPRSKTYRENTPATESVLIFQKG